MNLKIEKNPKNPTYDVQNNSMLRLTFGFSTKLRFFANFKNSMSWNDPKWSKPI